MSVLSTLRVRVGLAAIIAVGVLSVLGLTSAAADPIGEDNNGPAGDYAGKCSGEKSDPVGIVFRGHAGVINVREETSEWTGWNNMDTGFSVFGFKLSSDKQGLRVRQPNGTFNCEENQAAIAQAGGANSRYHVRLWRAYSQAGNLVAVGTPHHEDFVKHLEIAGISYDHCELEPPWLKIGNHAVDKGGVKQPGTPESGFDKARHLLYNTFSGVGYTTSSEKWGNTQEYEQCDEDWAGSNGYGVTVSLLYSMHPLARTTEQVGSTTARLHGELITEEPQTKYWWAYGKKPAQGAGSYEHQTAEKSTSGSQQFGTSEPVSGLAASTTYYARMFARNQEGFVKEGPEVHFTTCDPVSENEDEGAGPRAVAQCNGTVDIFYRDASGKLGHQSYVPANGWSTETRPAAMASEPHPIVFANGTVNVFYRDTSGNLGNQWYAPGNGWSTETRPAAMASDPHPIAQANGTVDIFYRDTSGNLGHQSYVPGNGWSNETRPAAMASEPHPVVQANGTVDIFYRDTSGNLGHQWYVQGIGWSNETRPAAMAGEPHPTVQANGIVDVFYRDTSGNLGHQWYVPGNGWLNETRPAAMAGEPHPTAQGNGTVDIFYRDTSGNLGHHWYVPGIGWANDTRVASMASDPHPIAMADGTVDIFYRDTSGNLGHHWWTPGNDWEEEIRPAAIYPPLPAPEPPTVSSGVATSITPTGAILEGFVDPNGRATEYRFEYGTTTSYGQSTEMSSAGVGSDFIAVSKAVSGLKPETTYYFRVKASNAGGTTFGFGQTFTTKPTPPPALAVDKTVTTHQSTASPSISSPALTTTAPKELLLAFVSSHGPSGGTQSFSSVTGGGLTWHLVRRANVQAGTAEIWAASAAAVVSNATVTATRSSGSYVGSITVVALNNADLVGEGASAAASAASGAPSVTLSTTRDNSWVWGVGNDGDHAIARTVGSGQTKADEYLASTTDTFWVQRQNAVTPSAGTAVTLNDTAPTSDHWNLAAVEVVQAAPITWRPHTLKVLSGAETESIAGSGNVVIESTVLGSPTKIECGASNSGSISAGGGGTSTISLTKCAVAVPSKCQLASAPTLKAKMQLVEVGGKLFQKFTPAVGTSFGTVEYTGAECPFLGIAPPLKGSFAGSDNPNELSESRTLTFTKSEPWPEVALTLSNAAATMSGELVGQRLTGALANNRWKAAWGTGTGADWLVETGSHTLTAMKVGGGGTIFLDFTLLGSPVTISCSELKAEGANINSASTEGFTSISFAGCKVIQPSTCSLPGNKIQFPEMTGTLLSAGGRAYEKFSAAHPVFIEGTEQPMMSWWFEGSLCPLSGISMPVYKSFIALGPELGTLKGFQPFEFSKTISEVLPAEQRLRVGKNSPVNIDGSLLQEISGGQAGVPWGAY